MLYRNVAFAGLIAACIAVEAVAHTDAEDALARHCLSCHSDRGAAPFRFDSIHGLLRSRQLMRALIEDNTMPPSLVNDYAHPITNNRKLNAATKQVLLDALSTPESVRAAFPNFHANDDTEACDERLRFSPFAAWTMPASGGMRLRTYLVETARNAPARVRGFHSTAPRAFASSPIRMLACAPDPSRSLAILQEPNEAGFEAMGNVGTIPAGALGAITRVMPRFELPRGFTFLLPEGAIAMEMTSEPIGKAAPVEADLAWIESDAYDTRVVRAIALAPRQLRIPGGASLECARQHTIPRDLDLIGVIVKGGAFLRNVTLESRPLGGSLKPLLEIPDFRLALSEPWFFETPIALDRDERITATFGFDNTSENPQQPLDPPQEVIGGLPPEGEDSVVILLVADRVRGSTPAVLPTNTPSR